MPGRLRLTSTTLCVLVGGSTRISRVRRMLTGFFHGRNLIVSEVDEGVVKGAALQAAIVSGKGQSERPNSTVLLFEATPFGYCCKIDDGDMVTIMKCNSTVPAKSIENYHLPWTKQPAWCCADLCFRGHGSSGH